MKSLFDAVVRQLEAAPAKKRFETGTSRLITADNKGEN